MKDRDKKILEAVVLDFIRTAEPVGSRTIKRRYGLEVSPATIRNVMADLEERELLSQPHTSAGRVPTEKGLRYYVDSILQIHDIPGEEKDAIFQEYASLEKQAEQILKHSSKVLSSVSRHIGVVLAPNFSRATLKHLQFVSLNDRLILVILVSRSGLVQNRIIETEESLKQDDLDRFNNYLNDILDGLTINEIKAKIVEEMRQEKNRFDRLYYQALTLSNQVFQAAGADEDVYIDGQVNLLEWPEFSDVSSMKSIFKTFEDKSILVRLLDNTLAADGVRIFIGSENRLAEMEGCTVIASRYSKGSKPLGTLGVIGPTWINYSRIIPVVDYTAKLVSRILESTF